MESPFSEFYLPIYRSLRYDLWMKVKKLWERWVGPHRVRMEEIEGEGADSGPQDYPLSRTTWSMALKLKKKYGSDQALELIDQRAWKAFRRNDDKTAIRWRNLIIAIHAMEEDELRPGEKIQ